MASDTGVYKCEFRGADLTIPLSSETDLAVRLLTKSPSLATVVSFNREELKLTCTYDSLSDPKPKQVTWDGPSGGEEEEEGGKYVLTLTEPDETNASGVYTCTFEFDEGDDLTETFTVDLNFIEMKSDAEIYTTSGDGIVVDLTCEVVTDTDLNIELVFEKALEEKEVGTDTDTVFDTNKETKTTKLSIDDPSKSGEYYCMESASKEKSASSTTVKVMKVKTELDEVTPGIIGDSLTLECKVDSPDGHEPTFSWYSKDTLAAAKVVYDGDVITSDPKSHMKKSQLVFPSLTDDHMDKYYGCEATWTGLQGVDPASQTLSSETSLQSSYIFSITPYIFAFTGDAVTFECQAKIAGQTESFKWTIGEDEVHGLDRDSEGTARSVYIKEDVFKSDATSDLKCSFGDLSTTMVLIVLGESLEI